VSPKVGGPGAEETDQPVEFVLGQEVRYGLIDFVIGKPFGNIFGVPIQREKVVKVPEGPNPGFPDMDGWMIEFSRECCQV
jgi:hypothetical protein